MADGGTELKRTLGLPGAVTLNLLDMIGVGPFITLPLLVSAMGGPQAMLGWLLGAALAVCDGLVWAELGAAMPEAGGTYTYLRHIFPGRTGRWLSFLFVFQLCISAPLSVASGSIGLSQYAGALWAPLRTPVRWHTLRMGPYGFGFGLGLPTLLAIAAVLLAVVLLYRRLVQVEKLGWLLLLVVLGTILWTGVTAGLHGSWQQAVAVPPGAFHLSHSFFLGLGSAMLLATYDFWGYYNVTFLGGEVRDPERTVPRALLLSIVLVAGLYLLLNVSVLALLGVPAMLQMARGEMQPALLTAVMQTAYAGAFGTAMGRLAAVLVMVTGFAGIFALLLGYSRVPFAAARDGNFFPPFAKLHPRLGFPHVSLLVLAGGACVFSCFRLTDVLSALVVLRVVLQFGMQQVGVMVLRWRQPALRRPFRMPLFPLPPLLALAGFGFLVLSRRGFGRELLFSALVALVGSALFLVQDRRNPKDAAGRSVSGAVRAASNS